MFQKRLSKDNDQHRDANMTPLIDVALVLVVILLLATPLAFQSSIALRQSASAGKKAEKQEKDDRVEVYLLSEDSLLVNRHKVARTALAKTLGPLVTQSRSKRVMIRCANEVSHGNFVSVLDEAKLCGAEEIAMTER